MSGAKPCATSLAPHGTETHFLRRGTPNGHTNIDYKVNKQTTHIEKETNVTTIKGVTRICIVWARGNSNEKKEKKNLRFAPKGNKDRGSAPECLATTVLMQIQK